MNGMPYENSGAIKQKDSKRNIAGCEFNNMAVAWESNKLFSDCAN